MHSSSRTEGPPELGLTIFEDDNQVWHQPISNRLVLGRQDLGKFQPEPPPYHHFRDEHGVDRITIAENKERRFSRQHIAVDLQNDRIVVSNLSKIQPFHVNQSIVEPESSRTYDWMTTITIHLHNRSLVIQPMGDSGSLLSLSHRTRAPGSKLIPESFADDDIKLSEMDSVPEFMLWLSETIEVLQSAVNSPDFLQLACKAVVDIVKLDHAQILLLEDNVWRPHASHSRHGSQEAPPPSGQVLGEMMKEQKTHWLVPEPNPTMSLIGVSTVIASPILDAESTVIGTLYGDVRTSLDTREISELEAKMVEVLACAVASGLSTRKHQEEAIQHQIKAAEKQAMLEQFFSPQLATKLLEQPELLEGRDVEVTVLFCDLRKFTKVSDQVSARVVLAWLNAVQNMLSDCVIDSGGVLVDYVGDALMAMWGAPIDQPNHSTLACRAACAMIRQLPDIDADWKDVVGRSTRVGIGISTGQALVGNTGSMRKFKYGPLGRMVNVGSRVQNATRTLQRPILATSSVIDQIDEDFALRRIGRLRMHNLASSEMLFEINAHPTDEWWALTKDYHAALADFESGAYEKAAAQLKLLAAQWPQDTPAQCLQQRVQEALTSGNTTRDVWGIREDDEEDSVG